MIRKPRYPLVLRLAWIESEIDAAARLAHMVVRDVPPLLPRVSDAEARIEIVSSVLSGVLIVLGVSNELLDDWTQEMGPAGDVEVADEMAGDILRGLLFSMRPPEGEG